MISPSDAAAVAEAKLAARLSAESISLCSEPARCRSGRSARFLRWLMGCRGDRQPAALMRVDGGAGMGRPGFGLCGAVRRRAGGKSARRAVFRGLWCRAGSVRPGLVAGGRVGGRATFLWLLFPCLVGVPGDQCGGARPRASVSWCSFLGACSPWPGAAGSVGRVSVLVS